MSKRLLACVCSFLVLVALSLVPDDADAARIGGGRSFGGRPSMSTPYSRPAPSSPTMRQQTNRATQQPGAAAAAPNRGLFGGMGGMLGGLLAGGLIGSLLFGGGGMGGGMGGLLDIILIGALIYFGIKFFRRRAAARQEEQASGMMGRPAGQAGSFGAMDYRGAEPEAAPVQRSASSGMGGMGGWGALASNPAASDIFTGTPDDAAPSMDLPADFDEEEFLRGAKTAYARLNASWDKRDLDDIAQFSTPAFMDEIRRQKEEDPTPGRTEIMLVNASVVEARKDGGDQIVSVYFDVLLRENPNQETPSNVREVWHFTRPIAGGMWKLDGIQQIEQA